MQPRDYVPISHTYPASRPFVDDNGKRRGAPLARDDLRVSTLKQQQQQQQAARGAAPATGAAAAAAAAISGGGDSRFGGVFDQQSIDGMEVQATATAGGVSGTGGDADGGGGATDFSAFNAQLRSQRAGDDAAPPPAQAQQQQQQQPPAGAARPPQPRRAQWAVTTFDALTTNRLPDALPDAAAQLEGLRSLYGPPPGALGGIGTGGGGNSNSGWPLARGSGGGGGGTMSIALNEVSQLLGNGGASQAALQQQQQQYELTGLAAAPWDWSLKTRVRIASPAPLACLRGGPASASACFDPAAAADPAERVAAALAQWQHPAAPLPPDTVSVLAGSSAGEALLAARAQQWRDALRGLHQSVRRGAVPAAYVAGVVLFHQPLSILFLAPNAAAGGSGDGSGSGGEPAAVVSRSNRRLRQALDAVAAPYTMAAATWAPGSDAGQGGKQQQQQQQDASGAAPSAADGRAGSQLFVRGARGVQALYLLLLQQPWCRGGAGAGDVPALLAPAPFAGATLCTCSLQELPGSAGQASASAAATQPLRRAGHQPPHPQHGPRFAGLVAPSGEPPALVAPWALARLAAALSVTEAAFEIFADADPSSAGLNLPAAVSAAWGRPAAAAGMDGEGGGGSGGISDAERAAWPVSCRQLNGRYVRALRFADGAFSARLGAP